MAGIRIEFGLDDETRRFLSHLLTERLDRLQHAVAGLETHMSKIIDDKLAAFKASVDAQFAVVNTNLDNIVADEAGLAKQITDLQAQIAADANSDLSPASQALLDQAVTDATAIAARTKATADSVPDTVTPPVG